MEELKVEFFIPGELKDERIMCDIIRNYDINLKIVEASFSTESGWAYLFVNGEKPEINRLFGYLQGKDITVEIK